MPTGVTVASVNQILCAGTTACLVTGASSTSALILTGGAVASQTWINNSGFSANGVSELTQSACPSTTLCLVSGYTSGASGRAIVLSGVLSTSGGQTFSAGTMPSTITPVVLLGSRLRQHDRLHRDRRRGIRCVHPQRRVRLTLDLDQRHPVQRVHRRDVRQRPRGVGGQQQPAALQPADRRAPTRRLVPTPASIGPLFPFSSGYSVGAGDCTADITNSSAASTSPGGTDQLTNATVVLPLGPAVDPGPAQRRAGQRGDGDGDRGQRLVQQCRPYTLQKTGPDGLSRVAVIYETYTVAVSGTYSGSVTVTVGTAGSTVSSVLTPAPIPIQVNV